MSQTRDLLLRTAAAATLIAAGAALGIAVERRAWDFIAPTEPLEGAMFLAGWAGIAALAFTPALAALAVGALLLQRLRRERREVARLARDAAIVRAGTAETGNIVLVWPPVAAPGDMGRGASQALHRSLDPEQPAHSLPWLLSPGRLIGHEGGPAGSASAVPSMLGTSSGSAAVGAATLEGQRRLLPLVLSRLQGLLAPADLALLDGACAALRLEGTAFELVLDARAGVVGPRRLRALGRRIAAMAPEPPLDVLWLVDETPGILIEEAEARAARADARTRELKALLDAIPLPIWRRGADDRIVDWNVCYAAAAGYESDGGPADFAGKALARRARDEIRRSAGGAAGATESAHRVVGGARRLFSLAERAMPGVPGSLAGHALDITSLEQVEAELARHIEAHRDVLQNLGIAIEIYGADRRLDFRNGAYEEMTQLPPAWLASRPSVEEVLERLRERRLLPEDKDFAQLRKERLALFTAIEPGVQALHLPDGRIWRMSTAPHPFGGVLAAYEDVTDAVALERSFNALVTFQREVLENLYEGIAVFGPDGRLELHNPAFAEIWQLTPMMLASRMHVRDFCAHIQHFFPRGSPSFHWRGWALDRASEPYLDKGKVIRNDGAVLDYACVPLRESRVLFSFSDETQLYDFEARLEREARLANRAALLAASALAAAAIELPELLAATAATAAVPSRIGAADMFGARTERAQPPSALAPSALISAAEIVGLLPALGRDRSTDGARGPRATYCDAAAVAVALVPLLRERARRLGVKLVHGFGAEQPATLPLPVDHDRLLQALFHGALDLLASCQPGDCMHIVADAQAPENSVRIGLMIEPDTRRDGRSRSPSLLGLPALAAVAAIAAAQPYGPTSREPSARQRSDRIAGDTNGTTAVSELGPGFASRGSETLPLFPFLETEAAALEVRAPEVAFFPGAGLGEVLLAECAADGAALTIEHDEDGTRLLRLMLVAQQRACPAEPSAPSSTQAELRPRASASGSR